MLNYAFQMRTILVLLILLVVFSTPVSAGQVTVGLSFEEPQDAQAIEGGATVQTLEAQTSTETAAETITELTTEPEEEAPEEEAEKRGLLAGTTSAGIGVIYSKHLQVYKIPISYKITKSIKLGLILPYVRKDLKGRFGGEDLTDEGLGDIATSVKYIISKEKFRLVSTLFIKFPTGNNKQFEDGKERLSLGTGSYDWIWSESILLKTDRFKKIRYLGGLSYRYNGRGDYSEKGTISGVTGNYTFNNKKGDVLFGFAGVEWLTPKPKLRAYFNLAGMYIWAGDEEYHNDTYTVNVKRDLDDSLGTFDVIPGIKYQITKKSAARLGAIIPVYTQYDPDIEDEKSRGISVDFGFDYIF